jgi:hypothetical protein
MRSPPPSRAPPALFPPLAAEFTERGLDVLRRLVARRTKRAIARA